MNLSGGSQGEPSDRVVGRSMDSDNSTSDDSSPDSHGKFLSMNKDESNS